MRISTILNKSFADHLWNPMPGWLQFAISKIYTRIYTTALSRLIIGWFSKRYGLSVEKLKAYKPASGEKRYKNFQDFFARKLVSPPEIRPDENVWPCEGNIVEFGQVKNLELVHVKGQTQSVANIFGRTKSEISKSFFVNIFLHNHHYHRFHAPVSGRLVKIERIPGKLSFLRPWFYKKSEVSKPSLVNERVILEIRDVKNNPWYLAIVGGMGVGTIVLNANVNTNQFVNCGDEIGHFLLGSTICLAIPDGLEGLHYMKSVTAMGTMPLKKTSVSELIHHVR